MKYLYGFSYQLYGGLEIKKFEIESETKGQYLLKDCVVRRVRKAEMQTYDYYFFETEKQAIDGLIEHCKQRIVGCATNIQIQQDRIARYDTIIKQLKKGGSKICL